MNTRVMSLVSLCAAAVLMAGCATSHHHATVWEYKIVHGSNHIGLEEAINKAATDGWQLQGFQPDGDRIPFAVMRKHRE